MINIQLLRDNPEKVKDGAMAKGYDVKIIDDALKADATWREALRRVEELRAERNKAAKEKDIQKGKEIKSALKSVEPQLEELENKVNELLNQIPNLPDDSAPRGKDDRQNVEVRK